MWEISIELGLRGVTSLETYFVVSGSDIPRTLSLRYQARSWREILEGALSTVCENFWVPRPLPVCYTLPIPLNFRMLLSKYYLS